MSRRTIRCLSPALLAVAVLLLGAATAFAQHTTGFNMTKTCPTVVASGASFQCSVTLSNNDVDHGVINLVVTNQVPSPGGPTTTLSCRQPFNPADCTAGSVVTTLGASGSPTASCGACIPETAPINCGASNISYVDEVRATGTDAAQPPSPFVGLPVSSSTTNATPVAPLVCNDNNSCTSDLCSTETGCSNTPVSCGDNNACTTDSCNPATGCVNAAVSCDDNNSCTDDSCDAVTGCAHTDNGSCNGLPGRMTGGGSVFGKGSQRVTHGFELHCDPEVGPNNLEVNWGGNHFHMEELLTAVCTDDPSIAPPPPPAGFDTYTGTGTGRCNGADGATISFVFTDAGEPGKFDTAEIQISGCPSIGGITVSGPLKKGNHQAHAH